MRRRVRASFPACPSLSRLEQFRPGKLSQTAPFVRVWFARRASVLCPSPKWRPIFFMTDKSSSRKENRQKATLNRLLPHANSFFGICLGQLPPRIRIIWHLVNEEFPLRSANRTRRRPGRWGQADRKQAWCWKSAGVAPSNAAPRTIVAIPHRLEPALRSVSGRRNHSSPAFPDLD